MSPKFEKALLDLMELAKQEKEDAANGVLHSLIGALYAGEDSALLLNVATFTKEVLIPRIGSKSLNQPKFLA
jgi:dsRNA-specific ribonuclease